jgi:hypothetical protein
LGDYADPAFQTRHRRATLYGKLAQALRDRLWVIGDAASAGYLKGCIHRKRRKLKPDQRHTTSRPWAASATVSCCRRRHRNGHPRWHDARAPDWPPARADAGATIVRYLPHYSPKAGTLGAQWRLSVTVYALADPTRHRLNMGKG